MADPLPEVEGPDLRHHGDRELAPGLVDLAVNVRRAAPPAWLVEVLVTALGSAAAYPDPSAATAAVARRHDRPEDDVLVTSGGAEAFTLLARALRPGVDVRRAVVVHPQFTEPEQALRLAGHRVERLLLRPEDGFVLDPASVPADADLVVVGNPTNPTSVLHPAGTVRALVRPGRVLVVDEAFVDAVPGEPGSLAGELLPGLVVVRSLTKTWALAGVRAGYVTGDPALVGRLRAVQTPWSVSGPALAAVAACQRPDALAEAEAQAREGRRQVLRVAAGLAALGLAVVPPAAPFVCARAAGASVLRTRLRRAGFAVRRGDTFPGLGPDWLRVAARDDTTTDAFLAALRTCLT